MGKILSMICRHILGVYSDWEGNIYFEYEDTDGMDLIFKFCPECGVSLGFATKSNAVKQ